jgi:protein TonB
MSDAALGFPVGSRPCDRAAPRWGLCFAAVLAAHAGVALFLLRWHDPVEPPSAVPAAIEIDLAPAEAPAAPVPPRSEPEMEPAPEPAKPPPEPAALEQAPKLPVPEAAPEPEVAIPPPRPKPVPHRPPPAPAKRPQAERPGPAAPAAPPTAPPAEAPPAAAAEPVPGQAATRPLPPTNALPSFENVLLAHLARYKQYPPLARRRLEQGVPVIRFTIDRQGHVLAAALERGSGHALLDEEALAMLRRAQPLPPIPPGLERDTLELVAPIRFTLH